MPRPQNPPTTPKPYSMTTWNDGHATDQMLTTKSGIKKHIQKFYADRYKVKISIPKDQFRADKTYPVDAESGLEVLASPRTTIYLDDPKQDVITAESIGELFDYLQGKADRPVTLSLGSSKTLHVFYDDWETHDFLWAKELPSLNKKPLSDVSEDDSEANKVASPTPLSPIGLIPQEAIRHVPFPPAPKKVGHNPLA